ncbi:unnamed protein product [Linum tenue]|uniref:Uncharacterized protein n=1 Tax=Linum tenue TaxID=586396 RepID=A0AAV0ICL6_9ROSI|nr:unnamed protein product [Linum tenue]CAI0395090.1 unnamed protein product [Linum tenue]
MGLQSRRGSMFQRMQESLRWTRIV